MTSTGFPPPYLSALATMLLDHLIEAEAIPDPDRPILDPDREGRGLGLRGEARHHRLRQLHQIHLLRLEGQSPGADARDVEQLRHQRLDPVDLAERDLGVVAEGVGAAAASDDFELQLERRQRRVQLVRGEREEVIADADGLPQLDGERFRLQQ